MTRTSRISSVVFPAMAALFLLAAATSSQSVGAERLPLYDAAASAGGQRYLSSGSSRPFGKVVFFIDLACPKSAVAWPTLKQLVSQYRSRLEFVFHVLPLSDDPIGFFAAKAVQVLLTFTDMTYDDVESFMDWVFHGQDTIRKTNLDLTLDAREVVSDWALSSTRMPAGFFHTAMQDPVFDEMVLRDLERFTTSVPDTPIVILNSRFIMHLQGRRDLMDFQMFLEFSGFDGTDILSGDDLAYSEDEGNEMEGSSWSVWSVIEQELKDDYDDMVERRQQHQKEQPQEEGARAVVRRAWKGLRSGFGSGSGSGSGSSDPCDSSVSFSFSSPSASSSSTSFPRSDLIAIDLMRSMSSWYPVDPLMPKKEVARSADADAEIEDADEGSADADGSGGRGDSKHPSLPPVDHADAPQSSSSSTLWKDSSWSSKALMNSLRADADERAALSREAAAAAAASWRATSGYGEKTLREKKEEARQETSGWEGSAGFHGGRGDGDVDSSWSSTALMNSLRADSDERAALSREAAAAAAASWRATSGDGEKTLREKKEEARQETSGWEGSAGFHGGRGDGDVGGSPAENLWAWSKAKITALLGVDGIGRGNGSVGGIVEDVGPQDINAGAAVSEKDYEEDGTFDDHEHIFLEEGDDDVSLHSFLEGDDDVFLHSFLEGGDDDVFPAVSHADEGVDRKKTGQGEFGLDIGLGEGGLNLQEALAAGQVALKK